MYRNLSSTAPAGRNLTLSYIGIGTTRAALTQIVRWITLRERPEETAKSRGNFDQW
jgi:hypothetical protein